MLSYAVGTCGQRLRPRVRQAVALGATLPLQLSAELSRPRADAGQPQVGRAGLRPLPRAVESGKRADQPDQVLVGTLDSHVQHIGTRPPTTLVPERLGLRA